LALKSNHTKAETAVQPPFHAHSEPHLAGRPAEHCCAAVDAAHGRTVRRRVWIITALPALPALAQWPGRQAVIAVATMRRAQQHAPVTRDYRVSIARLARSATACVAMMRPHGDREHKLQWS